jgi:hypothetical protein
MLWLEMEQMGGTCDLKPRFNMKIQVRVLHYLFAKAKERQVTFDHLFLKDGTMEALQCCSNHWNKWWIHICEWNFTSFQE